MTNIALEERKMIKNLLSDIRVKDFVIANLRESLTSIGFSPGLIKSLTNNLPDLSVKEFQNKFSDELEEVYQKGFFQKIVPAYFKKFVLPKIQKGKILDIGCGTGILLKELSSAKGFGNLLGIDVAEYAEWKLFRSPNVRFEVVGEVSFPGFIEANRPDSVVLTWTLHHMKYSEQERYMKMIYKKINTGSKIIVLEDSYSDELHPESGVERWRLFMEWPRNDRKKIMSVYDWIANRVLARRSRVPIPFGYRSVEEWISFFKKIGFTLYAKKFIGFPDQRDINTPRALLILKK